MPFSRLRSHSATVGLLLFASTNAFGQAPEQRVSGTLIEIGRGALAVRTEDRRVEIPFNTKTTFDVSGKGPRALVKIGSVVGVGGTMAVRDVSAKNRIVKGANITLFLGEQSRAQPQMIVEVGKTEFGANIVGRVVSLNPLSIVILPLTPKVLTLSREGKVGASYALQGGCVLDLADPSATEITVSFGKNVEYAGRDATIHVNVYPRTAPFATSVTILRNEPIAEPPAKGKKKAAKKEKEMKKRGKEEKDK
jgi:hypothetical protein